MNGKNEIKSNKKAYDNASFLHGKDGRVIRMIAEYMHPESDLRKKGVKGTIVFYGSARTLPLEKYDAKMNELYLQLKDAQGKKRSKINKEITQMRNNYDLTKYYEDGVRLSNMLANWLKDHPTGQGIKIASGGGPGMMEAANKGAYTANTHSIGFNISLPFEQNPNQFITKDLNFEFHYFFMRKFWFVYLAKAIIAMPGGFGTLDELMDILTLRQTKKVVKPLPIILYGSEFWKNVINFNYLIEKGMISKDDLKYFKFCDTPEEAFEYLKQELNKTLTGKYIKRTTKL